MLVSSPRLGIKHLSLINSSKKENPFFLRNFFTRAKMQGINQIYIFLLEEQKYNKFVKCSSSTQQRFILILQTEDWRYHGLSTKIQLHIPLNFHFFLGIFILARIRYYNQYKTLKLFRFHPKSFTSLVKISPIS